jgi:aryl-alcohol dehydrogenase-like predicted oxidoreductase
VEIYFMHHIDRRTTWDELWGAFEPLVTQGKVDYIGSSNFAGWHIAQAQASATQRHFMGIICEQTKYNLNCRLPELEVLPSAKSHGIGVVPWSPLDGGLLGRNALRAEAHSRTANLAGAIERNRSRLQAFGALCRDLGEHEDDVALAWLLANPAISAPIIGPRTMAQLEHSLRAIEITLSSETMNRIDLIFPGPGGEAPEAYAW